MDPQVNTLLKRIDDATNDVAKKLDDLAAKIAAGMTPEEQALVVASLQTEADRLEAMGKSPTNPTPPVPEVPPAPVEGS